MRYISNYNTFLESIELKHSDTTLQEIADKHNIDVKYLEEIIPLAIEIEYEHTDDKDVAETIAKAHLLETPLYYDDKFGLPKMEKDIEELPDSTIKEITDL